MQEFVVSFLVGVALYFAIGTSDAYNGGEPRPGTRRLSSTDSFMAIGRASR